jgi:hypothetical protein
MWFFHYTVECYNIFGSNLLKITKVFNIEQFANKRK